jgi:uncharacterized protein YciI
MARSRLAASIGGALLACAMPVWFATAAAEGRVPDMSTMDRYLFAILSRGPGWTPERTPHTDSVQAGHMANLQHMASIGVLVGAGPFQGNGAQRGLFIFHGVSVDSAERLCAVDPAVRAGRLVLEFHPWLAPKGIGDAYEERAKRNPEHRDSMITLAVVYLKSVPNAAPVDSARLAAMQREHLDTIMGMLLSGEMLAAGPILDSGPIRGVGVFGSDSLTAQRRCQDDPLVRAGQFSVETRMWWTAWGVMPPTPTVRVARP